MKEVSQKIKYKDKEYKMVFNLNVMQEIQEEYGSLQKWGELTDGNPREVKNGKKTEIVRDEPNIKALIFGLAAMINEGIEIDNEENKTSDPALSLKAVGRILTDVGIENVTDDMNNLVIDSTKVDEKN